LGWGPRLVLEVPHAVLRDELLVEAADLGQDPDLWKEMEINSLCKSVLFFRKQELEGKNNRPSEMQGLVCGRVSQHNATSGEQTVVG